MRIWSLSGDNAHSWVRISHGSNKLVMDSNNNETEIPEDQPEEQALQLDVKDFACRSKAKAKPQRREPAGYSPSIIPMNERKWIAIEPGNYSLSLRTKFRRKYSIFFVILSKYIEKRMERFTSGESKKIFRVSSHKLLIGLTIDGQHAWQQEEEQKDDSSTALMNQE